MTGLHHMPNTKQTTMQSTILTQCMQLLTHCRSGEPAVTTEGCHPAFHFLFRASDKEVGSVFEFNAKHKLVLVVDKATVDGSAVLKIDLALGGFPFARLGLVILKHLCG